MTSQTTSPVNHTSIYDDDEFQDEFANLLHDAYSEIDYQMTPYAGDDHVPKEARTATLNLAGWPSEKIDAFTSFCECSIRWGSTGALESAAPSDDRTQMVIVLASPGC